VLTFPKLTRIFLPFLEISKIQKPSIFNLSSFFLKNPWIAFKNISLFKKMGILACGICQRLTLGWREDLKPTFCRLSKSTSSFPFHFLVSLRHLFIRFLRKKSCTFENNFFFFFLVHEILENISDFFFCCPVSSSKNEHFFSKSGQSGHLKGVQIIEKYTFCNEWLSSSNYIYTWVNSESLSLWPSEDDI